MGGIEGAILILAASTGAEKDRDSIRKVVSIGVKFALGVGLFTTLVAVLFPQWVIRIFTTEPASPGGAPMCRLWVLPTSFSPFPR